jgi:hypothetical protein
METNGLDNGTAIFIKHLIPNGLRDGSRFSTDVFTAANGLQESINDEFLRRKESQFDEIVFENENFVIRRKSRAGRQAPTDRGQIQFVKYLSKPDRVDGARLRDQCRQILRYFADGYELKGLASDADDSLFFKFVLPSPNTAAPVPNYVSAASLQRLREGLDRLLAEIFPQ